MLSVIMLTYNRKSFVCNMIKDIINQTFNDFEYLIIDNGSDDGTDELLRQYAAYDARIRVFSIEKSSIGKARNIGVKESKGDYITFVDDDDRVEPDYLKFLYDLLIENEADISICGTSEGDGIVRNPQCLFDEKMIVTGSEAVSMLLDRKKIRAGMPGKLYKRKILEYHPFPENVKNEDIHTQYRCLLSAKKVAMHGKDKYYILRHEQNVSRFTSKSNEWDFDTMNAYLLGNKNRTEYIRKIAPQLHQKAQYAEWSFMISMIDKINKYNLKDCMELDKKMRETLRTNKEEFYNMKEIKQFEMDWMKRYIE